MSGYKKSAKETDDQRRLRIIDAVINSKDIDSLYIDIEKAVEKKYRAKLKEARNESKYLASELSKCLSDCVTAERSLNIVRNRISALQEIELISRAGDGLLRDINAIARSEIGEMGNLGVS